MSHLFRDHHVYHERRLEQQQLDALLRIEEILARAFPEPQAKSIEPEVDTLLENKAGSVVNVRSKASPGKRR